MKALYKLMKNSDVIERVGNNLQIDNRSKNETFQYPENGALKLRIDFGIRGDKRLAKVHVQARQQDKPNYFKFNWIYEEISIELENGQRIPIEIK